jgi:hypothetical protein
MVTSVRMRTHNRRGIAISSPRFVDVTPAPDESQGARP